MTRNIYCRSLAALLTDADSLGSTPDAMIARAAVLAELRRLCLDAANYLDDLGTASGDTMAARLRAAGGAK